MAFLARFALFFKKCPRQSGGGGAVKPDALSVKTGPSSFALGPLGFGKIDFLSEASYAVLILRLLQLTPGSSLY